MRSNLTVMTAEVKYDLVYMVGWALCPLHSHLRRPKRLTGGVLHPKDGNRDLGSRCSCPVVAEHVRGYVG